MAGATIEGEVGDLVSLYAREVERIQNRGGTPILFQSSALTGLPDGELVEVYRRMASGCDALLAFELGKMFAPFGRIYCLEVVEELMRIPQIVGIKHSSLQRELEWQRLELRDRVRPDFKIYTCNDLAIDMMMYGSDYLLGLSTFAPDFFARRDACWLNGDARFYALNDVLQYLGQFAFRAPTPAYKHSAAQFLKLRGWIQSDTPHSAMAKSRGLSPLSSPRRCWLSGRASTSSISSTVTGTWGTNSYPQWTDLAATAGASKTALAS